MSHVPAPLGTIYLPKSGTTVGTFEFVIDPDSGIDVQIDSPVAAETTEGVIVGTVIDMRTIGSLVDPLSVQMPDKSGAAKPLANHRAEVKLATVQVFYSPALRSVSAGVVREATAEELQMAMGVDRIDVQVPAGVVPLGHGQYAKAVLDMHTLLGPESAHLMIGGLSGQAAKTSFAGVLMRSAIHAGNPETDSVAALVFNVKGMDLVNLDQPPAAGYELTDADLAMYEAMGVPATPFEDVTVYAPSLPGGSQHGSTRADALALRWDLRQVWRYLRYFSPGLYSSDNMVALLADLENEVVFGRGAQGGQDTFDKLGAWFDGIIERAEEEDNSTPWRSHHIATIRKAAKLIGSMPAMGKGLIATGKTTFDDDIPVDTFRHGQVISVDIAGLDTVVQAAVIARTADRLLRSAEDGGLGVDHLIVFADEMNVFAPSQGAELELVRKALVKIAATGRYAGVSLWGAAQFLSAVTPQITGNSATRACGIISDQEADSGVYGRLPAGQRERLVTLPKGAVAIKAYNLRGMLTVSFPRPAWCTGRPKGVSAKRAKVVDTLGLRSQSIARLSEGIDPETRDAVIAKHDGNTAAAMAELDASRVPDMAKVSVETSNTFDAEDVWALD